MPTDSGRGMRFARLLRRYRKHAGFSQETLAEKVGRRTKTISSWERGIRWPIPESFGAIFQALELSDDEQWLLQDAIEADKAEGGTLGAQASVAAPPPIVGAAVSPTADATVVPQRGKDAMTHNWSRRRGAGDQPAVQPHTTDRTTMGATDGAPRWHRRLPIVRTGRIQPSFNGKQHAVPALPLHMQQGTMHDGDHSLLWWRIVFGFTIFTAGAALSAQLPWGDLLWGMFPGETDWAWHGILATVALGAVYALDTGIFGKPRSEARRLVAPVLAAIGMGALVCTWMFFRFVFQFEHAQSLFVWTWVIPPSFSFNVPLCILVYGDIVVGVTAVIGALRWPLRAIRHTATGGLPSGQRRPVAAPDVSGRMRVLRSWWRYALALVVAPLLGYAAGPYGTSFIASRGQSSPTPAATPTAGRHQRASVNHWYPPAPTYTPLATPTPYPTATDYPTATPCPPTYTPTQTRRFEMPSLDPVGTGTPVPSATSHG